LLLLLVSYLLFGFFLAANGSIDIRPSCVVNAPPPPNYFWPDQSRLAMARVCVRKRESRKGSRSNEETKDGRRNELPQQPEPWWECCHAGPAQHDTKAMDAHRDETRTTT
jgi:hypothetical protein